MELTIIVVNRNGLRVLQPCLSSIYEQTKGIDFEVLVVDNASTDGSREMVSREFPQVKLIENRENVGFAAANNRGIAQARGKCVLLLNPDTEVHDAAIQKSLHCMERHPGAGVVGCKLLFPDGRTQRSVRSFPSLWNVFCESSFLYRVFPSTKLFGAYYLSYFDYSTEAEVDWVSGAFMVIKKSVFDRIGLLDEQFYMYTEEVDFCYRAKHAGFEVWFTPDGEVTHFWGGMNAVNARVILWTQASQIMFVQKHFVGPEKALMVAIKYFGMGARIVVYLIIGSCTFNRKFMSKSYYYAFALFSLLFGSWKYQHDFVGKVEPW